MKCADADNCEQSNNGGGNCKSLNGFAPAGDRRANRLQFCGELARASGPRCWLDRQHRQHQRNKAMRNACGFQLLDRQRFRFPQLANFVNRAATEKHATGQQKPQSRA